jgi:hypothetical protein
MNAIFTDPLTRREYPARILKESQTRYQITGVGGRQEWYSLKWVPKGQVRMVQDPISPWHTVAFIGSFTERGTTYEIKRSRSGKYSCTCPHYQQRLAGTDEVCKHVKYWLEKAGLEEKQR